MAIGQLAAMRLLARLDGDESPAQQIIVPTHLIVRGSGELAG
jgi:LacI family transcriptional regulator